MPFPPQWITQDLVEVDFNIDLLGTVDGAHSAGDTTIAVADFADGVPDGCVIVIESHSRPYYITTGGASSIDIDPPLEQDIADNEVITILPHFEVQADVISITNRSRSISDRQFELITDRQLDIEISNFDDQWYDHLTHSTAWTYGGAYLTTYNSQVSPNMRYVRVSIKRGSTWYPDYDGEIDSEYVNIDMDEKTIHLKTYNCVYQLKKTQIYEIAGLKNLHSYTSDSAKTKTVSGKYYDIIREMYKHIGIQPKDYTVTNMELTSDGVATLTIGAHTVQVGELVSPSGVHALINGTWRVVEVDATTISFNVDSDPLADSQTTTGSASAGTSTVALSAAFGTFSGLGGNSKHKVRFSGHDYLYQFSMVDPTHMMVTPVLQSTVSAAETAFIGYQETISSGAASGTLTQHRIIFDDFTELHSSSEYNWSYDFQHCLFTAPKWQMREIDEIFAWDLMKTHICPQFNAYTFVKYIGGACYGMFRSMKNTSTVKGTISSSDLLDNASPDLQPRWQDQSDNGVIVSSRVTHYDGDVSIDENRYISGQLLTTLGPSERGQISVALTGGSLSVGDKFKFATHEQTYRVKEIITAGSAKTITAFTRGTLGNVAAITAASHGFSDHQYVLIENAHADLDEYWPVRISSANVFRIRTETTGSISGSSGDVTPLDTVIFDPPLEQSVKTKTWCHIVDEVRDVPIAFGECFSVLKKFPDILVTDADELKLLYNYGPTIAHYGQTIINDSSSVIYGAVNTVPLIPIEYNSEIPTGNAILITEAAVSSTFPDGSGQLRHLPLLTNDMLSRFRIADDAQDFHNTTAIWRFITAGFVDSFNEVTGENQMTLAIYYGYNDIYRVTCKMNDVDFGQQVTWRRLKKYGGLFGGGFKSYGPELHSDIEKLPSNSLKMRFKVKKVVTDGATRFDFNNAGLVTNELMADIPKKIDNTPANPDLTKGLFLHADVLCPYYDDQLYFIFDAPIVDTIYVQRFDNSDNNVLNTAIDYSYILPSVSAMGLHIGYDGLLYFCDQTGDTVEESDGLDYTTYNTLCGGGATSPALRATIDGANLSMNNPNMVWRAYRNFVAVSDRGNNKIILYDKDNDAAYCIADSATINNPNYVWGENFTRFWRTDYGSNIRTHGSAYLVSKQMSEFYAVNRRPITIGTSDDIIGEASLGDRFTIDTDIISSSGSGTIAWIISEEMDYDSLDHIVTFLEDQAA